MRIKSQVFDDGSHLALAHDGGSLYVSTYHVGYGAAGVAIDPQALIDALAQMFPDMKPTPPKPQIGDRVVGRGHPNYDWVVVGIDGDRAVVAPADSGRGYPVWWPTMRLDNLTVVKRAKP